MARPTVRILSRYLLRQHLAPLGFALAAFTLLMLLRQVAQQFGNLVGKGLPWSVILEVFLLSVPFIIAMTLPMAVLVAVLYAFSQLAGDHEITAMKASGVSLGRLVAPVLSAAALVAALAFLWSDQVLPRSNHRLRTLLVDIQRKKPSFSLKEQVINEVVERQFFLRAARIDPATNRLRDVTIYDLGDPERRRIISADSGRMAYTPGGRDLYLTLLDGDIREVNRTDPTQFDRTLYVVNKIRVQNVGNTLERTANDTYRSDREMSICEMRGGGPGRPHPGPALADGHLAGRPVPALPGPLHPGSGRLVPDLVDHVECAVELGGIAPVHLPDVAVQQREVQVAAPRGIGHAAAVGADDAPPLGVPEVVDRDVPQPVGRRIDACRPEEELARDDLVDHLLLQAEGRLLALDVHEQRAQPMVRAGQHLIAPQERQRCDQRGRRQHRRDEPPQADATRLHRRDLVVPREVADRVQHGHEHGHRQRHRDDERDGEQEDLEDHAPRQALADEVSELLGHLAEQHQEGERREREAERREVLAQHVAAEDAHGRSRHYIRGSSSLQVPFQLIVPRHRCTLPPDPIGLIGPAVSGNHVGTAQGMRRASLAGFVALSLVIPQAHAQDTGAARSEPPGFVASFRWTPLAPPRHPALVPGGRLGPHTAAALVAAAWQRRARALWSPALGQPVAAAPVAAAAPAPVPPEPTRPAVVPAAPPGGAPGPPGTFPHIGLQA